MNDELMRKVLIIGNSVAQEDHDEEVLRLLENLSMWLQYPSQLLRDGWQCLE